MFKAIPLIKKLVALEKDELIIVRIEYELWINDIWYSFAISLSPINFESFSLIKD
jgi:hypothetical protein